MATHPVRQSLSSAGTSLVANSNRRAAELELMATEAQFFQTEDEKEEVHNARHNYPRKAKPATAPGLANRELVNFSGEPQDDEASRRRIMGFGLGFEKIFATTSIKLPVSAYTLFAELHIGHTKEMYSRRFNGLHTVYDLKKWIFEAIQVPIDAYELSYAEPGKALLTEQLRLLTTQDSLDTRTLATARAVHRLYKGIPGVHSIDDIGVTRLYVRLKCRNCGQLLLNKNTRKCKQPAIQADGEECQDPGSLSSAMERCWHCPEPEKMCMFDTRGYEMFSAARSHGASSTSEIARIYIAREPPTKKLRLGKNVLNDP